MLWPHVFPYGLGRVVIEPAPTMYNPLRVGVGAFTGVSKGISRIQGLVIDSVTVYGPVIKLNPGVDEGLCEGVGRCHVWVSEPLHNPIIPYGIKGIIIAEHLPVYPHHIAVKPVKEVMYVLVFLVQHHKLVTVYE